MEQKVPGTNLPYIVHLSLVSMETMAALSVEEIEDPNLAIQCALLHDTIEDKHCDYKEIEKYFGKPVADGVMALTKNYNLKEIDQMNKRQHRTH